MAVCEMMLTCPFFQDQMKDMPATTEGLKKMYCMGDNTQCARFLAFKALGREKVPKDLYPNEVLRAKDLIERSRK